MPRRTFLVCLFLVAFGARVGTGALLLAQGPTEFVRASDDGDAYDAAARLQAFGTPIVMTERLAGKWTAAASAQASRPLALTSVGTPAATPQAGAEMAGAWVPGLVDGAARWPEGYWLFLAAQYRLFGSAFPSTIVLQSLLGAAGVLAGFALASRLLPEPVARLAGVGLALSTTGIYLSAALFAEALYIPLLMAGLALLAGQRRRWVWPAIAGALFGLAEVTRPLALAVFAATLIWLVATRQPRAALLLCAGFAAAIAPFLVHDLATTGQPLFLAAGGAEAVHDRAALAQPLTDQVLTLFVSGGWAPLGAPFVVGSNSMTVLMRLAEWALVLVGGVSLLLTERKSASLLALAALAIVAPALLLGLPLIRYRAPADPIFIICMTAGLVYVLRWARRSPALPAALCIAIASLSALTAAYDAWKVAGIAVAQLGGSAAGTDFLNLFAGADLLLHQPSATYQLDAQLGVQRSLTGTDTLIVPFYLPPYAAVSLAWLAWLPYGVAYLTWLLGGLACILLAAFLLAPRWTRWYPLVWLGVALLFLPTLLGLAQGQTSALMLASFALFAHTFTHRNNTHGSPVLGIGLLGWLIKPQLTPFLLFALARAQRWRVLALAGAAVCGLGALGAVRLGPSGIADYLTVSGQKVREALAADPVLLIGPTLLHASHVLFGVNQLALVVTAIFVCAVGLGAVYVWRSGPAQDDAILLQLAVLPIAAIIAAPYALIYELTAWLASFWLLWRYTEHRPAARGGLLWLTLGVLVAANIGVVYPPAFGADVAAVLGVGVVGYIAWLSQVHLVDRGIDLARQSIPHIPIE